MKLTHSFTFAAISLALVVGGRAQEAKAPAPAAAPVEAQPAAPAFTDEQVLEALGWFLAKNTRLEIFGLSSTQLDSLVKGLRVGASGGDLPYEKEKIGPLINEFVQKQRISWVEKSKQKNQAESAAYFEKLKENKDVLQTPSGLFYEILKPGEGAFPKQTDTVKVNYTGKLIDGTVFDSNERHNGGQPAMIPLEAVIAGWREGMQKINVGGKIRLHVPSYLGYGDEGNQGVPPASALIFEVELLEIKSAPAEAASTPEAAPAPAAPAPAAAK